MTLRVRTLLIFIPLIFAEISLGMSLNWEGDYRFELNEVLNPELDSSKRRKSYILNHLVLRPKIIAGDGLNIHLRLDVLNNANYPNSQLGDFMGNGPTTTGTPTNANDSSVVAQYQMADTILLNEAYLSWVQENGVLLVGRSPLHFGLGMTHNAGRGPFDHWSDARDLIGYKMISGNVFLLPIMGKMKEGVIGQEDDVTDYIIHFGYENEETGTALGVFYESRIATKSGNDAPVATLGGSGAVDGAWNGQNVNLYVERKMSNSRFAAEAGFRNGKSGLLTSGGEGVQIEGFGFATEFDYAADGSNWKFNLKTGIASGDNPNTEKYESFQFDRNYEIGFLLFNHPLGQIDLMRSNLIRDVSTTASSLVDEEMVGNAFYFSPGFTYDWLSTWDLGFRFTYAQLAQKVVQTGANNEVEADLGFEFDASLIYKPYKNVKWITELGFMFPGQAFKGGTNNFDVKTTYGIVTKAAISF